MKKVTVWQRVRNLGIFVLFLGLLGICGIVNFLAERNANNLVTPQPAILNKTAADLGYTDAQEITFTASDGVVLTGWFMPPANGVTVIFVNGHNSNRSAANAEAWRLRELGYGVLVFDLRGQNRTGGQVTMGLHEQWDVIAAFNTIAARPDVDPTRIVLYGQSMGGATSILAMAQLPTARALIVDTAYTSVIDVVSAGSVQRGFPPQVGHLVMWWVNQKSGFDLYQVRPIDVVGQIQQPILFMHGTEDSTIPYEHIERLYAAANDPKVLYTVEGGEHVTAFTTDPLAWQAQVLAFMEQHVLN
jgi:uncharacterized protein